MSPITKTMLSHQFPITSVTSPGCSLIVSHIKENVEHELNPTDARICVNM